MNQKEILNYIITKKNCREIFCSGRMDSLRAESYVNEIACPFYDNHGGCGVKASKSVSISNKMKVDAAKQELEKIEKLEFLEKL